MTRRRLVALVSAAALLGLGFLAVLVAVLVTQSGAGRDWVRELLLTRLKGSVNGRMYVGHISGGLLTGVVVDSIEIRDENDSLFLRTGRVTVTYDPRDLWDRRVLLGSVDVENPEVHLRRYENGEWNHKRIFRRGVKGPRTRTGPSFGDYIVARAVELHDGAFYLTMPWHPADSLHGARRDSAIAYNLARPEAEIRRAGKGFTRTWRWRQAQVVASYARIADPDSIGKEFVVDELDVDEADPPFRFRNVRASIRNLGDSVWLDIPHFDLPASAGRARGKIVWGSEKPVRYAIHVVGDSVALRDVAWVYPTLPREGGGSMELDIRNEPQNLNIIDYALSKMDVRTTGSRLKGAMTFGVGGPVLIVKDVALEAAPVDFDLLRTLDGKPFPVDWQGTLTGTVRGQGGPVNRFKVEESRLVFRDKHVPGAVSIGGGRGELDILFPAFTVFRGFDVEAEQVDLRTIENLYPNFPRLGGVVSGAATLDSSWLDVRISNGDIVHRNGPGDPSHLTGGGRVTWGEQFMTYDVDLNAAPLSLTSLARSYPALPLRGMVSGPIRAKGTIASLDLATNLDGPSGSLNFDGHLDAFPPGYRITGTGRVASLDLRSLLTTPAALPSALTVRFDADVGGDSLANLDGRLSLTTERSSLDRVLVYPSIARLRFATGRVFVDTLALETAAARLDASGALGLTRTEVDTLRFSILVDSLGGLRRFIGPPSTNAVPELAGPLPQGMRVLSATDSLAGTVLIDGLAWGAVDSVDIRGSVAGEGLYVRGQRAETLHGDFALADLLGSAHGHVALAVDTAVVGGVGLTRVGTTVQLADPTHARFGIDAVSASGPRLRTSGSVASVSGATTVAIDSAALRVRNHDWRLTGPARITSDSGGVAIDSLVLRDAEGGALSVRGTIPSVDSVRLAIAVDSVSLAEVGDLAQTRLPLDGEGTVHWQIAGTRARPEMQITASLADARFGGIRLQSLRARAGYRNRRLDGSLSLFRDTLPAVTATVSLPVDLALLPVPRRMLDEPLRGNVRADGVTLGVIEALSPTLERASGTLNLNVDVGGTWRKPAITGSVGILDGAVDMTALGIRVRELNADVRMAEDVISVRRFSLRSPGQGPGTASLRGTIDVGNISNPGFDLTANLEEFKAIDRPRIAELELSTERSGLRLTGVYRGARLTGTTIVNRGVIFIPDLVQKDVIELDDPEFYNIVDTTLYTNRKLVDAPGDFVKNLTLDNVRIRIGDQVWLRSTEANIQLGGEVEVNGSIPDRRGERTVALYGQLSADRGTYRLNLGVVQRQFEVDRGRLTFAGDRDLNPELDISAVHTVRQTRTGDDIRIRATIKGTFASPRLELSSDENYPISQSDLLSYLVTGAPSYELNSGNSSDIAASALIRSAGAYLGGILSNRAIDIIDIQTAGADPTVTGTGKTFNDVISNSRIGVGKQVGERTFISANTGLCSLKSSNSSSSDPLTFGETLGIRVEHRLSKGLSVEASSEPASTALLCGRSAARGLVSTPRQFGFDLFRTWQF
jgi:translocation and assembly module TamB